MKALSLTQPWASAIALGLKQWETRSWPTKFRGQVCIHAAKGYPNYAKEFAEEKRMSDLPLGVIICVADLVGCEKTEVVLGSNEGLYQANRIISKQEEEWGDYSDGRYAFQLENIKVLKIPVIAKGALNFWSVPWDIANEVLKGIK